MPKIFKITMYACKSALNYENLVLEKVSWFFYVINPFLHIKFDNLLYTII